MTSDGPVDLTEKFDERMMGGVPEGKEEPEGTPIESSQKCPHHLWYSQNKEFKYEL